MAWGILPSPRRSLAQTLTPILTLRQTRQRFGGGPKPGPRQQSDEDVADLPHEARRVLFLLARAGQRSSSGGEARRAPGTGSGGGGEARRSAEASPFKPQSYDPRTED